MSTEFHGQEYRCLIIPSDSISVNVGTVHPHGAMVYFCSNAEDKRITVGLSKSDAILFAINLLTAIRMAD